VEKYCFRPYSCPRVIEGELEGRIKVTGRRGKRRKQLLDDLRKRADIAIWKRKQWIALCWRLALEETMDLS